MHVSENASSRLKVTKIIEKCPVTDKLTVVYDDSKKESKQSISALPYFTDSKLFLITPSHGPQSSAAQSLTKEIRYGVLDPGDIVQASNLYTRMVNFKQQ